MKVTRFGPDRGDKKPKPAVCDRQNGQRRALIAAQSKVERLSFEKRDVQMYELVRYMQYVEA